MRTLVVASILCFGSSALAAPSSEVRATWLTTTASDAIATPAKTEATMALLREVGINTVYVGCWEDGYTAFPSATLRHAIGVPMKVSGTNAVQRDLLAETVLAAHRNGLLCYGWFEFGLVAASADTKNELRAKREWITLTADGSEVSQVNGCVWLNPFHPDVQQFLIDLSLDAVRDYDLDGVQLDGRIALPVDLGYDPYTRELYRKETGSYPPANPRDAKWMAWRADKISEFAQRYVTELRATHPDLLLSISPAASAPNDQDSLCDWVSWSKWCYCGGRRWDEYVPQCYRLDAATTVTAIKDQATQLGDAEKRNMIAGIRVGGDGSDVPFADIRTAIDAARQQQLAGHALWFSCGVLEIDPAQLKTYYGGFAPSPMRPKDWRPPPIIATRGENDAWTAKIESAGRYQLIARKDGVWASVMTLRLEPGVQTFVQDGDAVELLIDRRP